MTETKERYKTEDLTFGQISNVRDEAAPRNFYIMIPNLIDDLHISTAAFRLYVHLKRVTGETGSCWQSISTLANACGLSRNTVAKAKWELKDAGLIEITEIQGKHGEFPSHDITIKDVWQLNQTRYKK